jgi:sortase (surface protein transpeptidase)
MMPTPDATGPSRGRGRRLRAGAGGMLIGGGLLVMLAGGSTLLAREQAAQSWATSDEAVQAARQVDAPAPRWLDESMPTPSLRSAAISTPARATVPAAATTMSPPATPTSPPATTTSSTATRPGPASGTAPAADAELARITETATGPLAADGPATAEASDEEASPDDVDIPTAPRASAHDVEILWSEFRFLDPPEPGAQATIAIHVRNHSPHPTDTLRLTLSTRWLNGWRILDANPPILDDRVREGSLRAFDFPGLDSDAEGIFELHLVATDDAVDPPELRLSLVADQASGTAQTNSQPNPAPNEMGRVRPETVAPRPRPGPARAITIPRLGLRAAVVQTTWEPPAFVVGQLRETAPLSEGNTVLIGHLTGLAGNVFARLAELEPGDEIIATSRGLDYRFVVSETMTLPGDDSTPIQPTDEPRLTLMTCIGDWDPIGLDYSHRFWVVAEPPEIAETTLSGETPGPLTRQIGLAPVLTLLPPEDLGTSPKLAAPELVEVEPDNEPPLLRATIVQPAEGAHVGNQVVVGGRRAEGANPTEPLWLLVRAEIEGSRWYPYREPLTIRRDGTWEASVELGGGPGIHHTVLVAAVDPATDARLRRHVAQQPGQPLPILPDAFEGAARVTVQRR